MSVIDFSTGFGNASGRMTAFEHALLAQFEIQRRNTDHTHLCVALRYDLESPDNYIEPRTGYRIPASIDIFPLERGDDPVQTAELMAIYKDPIVIMLDLRGPSVAEQIPSWKPGTISFPAQFVQNPVLHMNTEPTPQPKQRPARTRPVFGVIDGGLSL